MSLRDLLVGLGLAAGATVLAVWPEFLSLGGKSIDVMFALRQTFLSRPLNPVSSPTVVVAIDEETYRRAPFKDTPRAMWTAELGQVIEAIMAGGAKVVGMDVIFPTSVAGNLPGFDRPYLRTLKRYAEQDRIVLGKVQHQLKPITPYAGQAFAVNHSQNIRATNLLADRDGVVRRIPLSFEILRGDGASAQEPSLSAELAARALGTESERVAEQSGSSILLSNVMLLNFVADQRSIPTYSLADLYACTTDGRAGFFTQHFSGKVVLVGTVLDVEDRILTSLRLATAPDAAAFAERCVHDPMPGLQSSDLSRDSIPGVYVHATAVNNLVQDDAVAELRPGAAGILVLIAALLSVLIVLVLRVWVGLGVLAAGTLLWIAGAAYLFESVALPMLQVLVAAGLSFAAMTSYRFAIVDNDRRTLQRLFGLYLPRAVIDQMVGERDTPVLGGETRELTVLFSDLADFSKYAEKKRPDEIVSVLNHYLNTMADIIEANRGIVDKYVGDAVMAVFGAPRHDPENAIHAVEAAIAAQDGMRHLNERLGLPEHERLRHRIGINSGSMLVGNIGSDKRLSYTVLGDAVNLAARLEQLAKVYRVPLIVGEATVRACGSAIQFRRLDRISVIGRSSPVDIYTLASTTGIDAAYEAALTDYCYGRFSQAATGFGEIGGKDAAAKVMASRCVLLAESRADWPGYYRYT